MKRTTVCLMLIAALPITSDNSNTSAQSITKDTIRIGIPEEYEHDSLKNQLKVRFALDSLINSKDSIKSK